MRSLTTEHSRNVVWEQSIDRRRWGGEERENKRLSGFSFSRVSATSISWPESIGCTSPTLLQTTRSSIRRTSSTSISAIFADLLGLLLRLLAPFGLPALDSIVRILQMVERASSEASTCVLSDEHIVHLPQLAPVPQVGPPCSRESAAMSSRISLMTGNRNCSVLGLQHLHLLRFRQLHDVQGLHLPRSFPNHRTRGGSKRSGGPVIFFFKFLYLMLAVYSLLLGLFSRCGRAGHSLAVVHCTSLRLASLVVDHGL